MNRTHMSYRKLLLVAALCLMVGVIALDTRTIISDYYARDIVNDINILLFDTAFFLVILFLHNQEGLKQRLL